MQTARQVNDLPLTGSQGRNYQSLLTIVPGAVKDLSRNVVSNGAGEANSAAGNPQRSISFNVNGVSRLQNNTRIDGSAVNYPWLPTNTAYVPIAESIQEVNIVTNAFDAEQGLAGGVIVNVITKSGTNGFHGAGWGYVTNSTIGKARNYFQTTPQNAKDILAQYGYAVGDPIWKNKLFFFTDLERTTRNNLSRVNRVSVAPAGAASGAERRRRLFVPAAARNGLQLRRDRADRLHFRSRLESRSAAAHGVSPQHHSGEPDRARRAP
ncbi:MAG TPA: hypothetical protein VIL74_07080 [Pyrinomonadaceae bacterium]